MALLGERTIVVGSLAEFNNDVQIGAAHCDENAKRNPDGEHEQIELFLGDGPFRLKGRHACVELTTSEAKKYAEAADFSQ
jgi:hypothetical protein